MGRQGPRIGDSGDDVTQDTHAGRAGDVADDIVELEVHLDEGLLHAPDMGRRTLNELLAVPKIRTQRGDLRIGPKAPAKQTDAVQLLDPLAI
jgi:hypothetical protein